MNTNRTELSSDRLLIRAAVADDKKSFQVIWEDFAQSQYVIYDAPLPTEDEKISAAVSSFVKSGLFFMVSLKGTDEVIGYVCFHDDGGIYDLGYLFLSQFQGMGYAYEACRSILDDCSTRGITHFSAHTALNNTPSVRLLERLGFQLRNTETVSFYKDQDGNNIYFDGGIFALNIVDQ